MDMAIVNAGQLDVYDQIDPELREACEDVIFDRRDDATERLVALGRTLPRHRRRRRESRRPNGARCRSASAWPMRSVKGIDAHIVEDTEEARASPPRARSTSSKAR